MFIILAIILVVFCSIFFFLLLQKEETSPQKKLLEETPTIKIDNFQRGLEEYRNAKFEKAQKYFVESLKNNASHIPSYQYLAQCYKAQKLIDQEIEMYIALLEFDLGNEKGLSEHAVRYELANLCFEHNMYLEAFNRFLILLHGSDFDADVVKKCAFIYASQAKYDFAEELYQKVLNKVTGDPEAKKGLILCYLGQEKPQMMKKVLKELIKNKSSENIHSYFLGKLSTGEKEIEDKLSSFSTFLKHCDEKDGILVMDTLLSLSRIYYKDNKTLEPDELNFWIDCFENIRSKANLSKSVNLELLLQLGFLHFFKNLKGEKFDKTRAYWKLGTELDADYRKIAFWLEFLKSYQAHKYKEFSNAFKKYKVEPSHIFPNEKRLDAKDFFHIFPIDINQCETDTKQKLGLFGTQKKEKESKLDSFSNLSSQQFEIKISKLLKEKSYNFVESINTNENKTFTCIVEDKKGKKQLHYCCAYQSTSPIGELELQNLLSSAKEKSLNNIIAINFSGFSKESKDFSKNYSIKLIDSI